MKQIIYRLTATLATLLTLAACVNDGDIGHLYGKWQLTEHHHPDGHVTVADSLFLNFEGKVVSAIVSHYNAHSNTYIFGEYRHDNDRLELALKAIQGDYDETDYYGCIDSIATHCFGFPGAHSVFEVKSLRHGSMEIAQQGETWIFRKF